MTDDTLTDDQLDDALRNALLCLETVLDGHTGLTGSADDALTLQRCLGLIGEAMFDVKNCIDNRDDSLTVEEYRRQAEEGCEEEYAVRS